MHSTQLSLFAPVKKKPSNVPVFLIYAGIIHAIGLALLLPMIVTLPGPGGDLTPQTSVIDVEIIPAPATTANVVGENEETAALPHKDEPASGDATIEPVGNVEPDVKPAEEPETPPAQGGTGGNFRAEPGSGPGAGEAESRCRHCQEAGPFGQARHPPFGQDSIEDRPVQRSA